MSKIDLHIHSNISDGKFTSHELIDIAKQNNVKIISIADHDNISVYTKELFDYAKEKEINLIPAVEISTKLNKHSIHILGYNIDLDNETLIDELKKSRNQRVIYLKEVTEKLTELGYYLNLDNLLKIEGVTKGHIAKEVVNNQKNKNKLLQEYNKIPSFGEFIETVMNPGCKGFVEKKTLTPIQAANLIKQANGKIVLAHPVAYEKTNAFSYEEIKNLLIEINADGIESNYIYINKDNEIIDDSTKWNNLANELNLFSTTGSDFHNFDNVSPEIGFNNYQNNFVEIDLPKELID